MRIIRSSKEMMNWRKQCSPDRSIGFVPTMGYLHEGHLSLVRRAKKENDICVVSIFVNPTQFAPTEDLNKYPRNEKRDLQLLREASCDLVFIPKTSKELYPSSSDVWVKGRESLTRILEGKFRPGHFDGVTTVVLKLFQLVQADRAYFGEKDYQQLQIIKAMVKDLFVPVKIVACPTIREKSGLAMSSRNFYFKAEDRETAARFSEILRTAKNPQEAKRKLKKLGFEVDYVECWNEDLSKKQSSGKGRWLAAVRWAGVRLIDNVKR